MLVVNEGSVVMFRPQGPLDRQWLSDNVQAEPWQWVGTALVVDHRFAGALIEGMEGDGVEVELARLRA